MLTDPQEMEQWIRTEALPLVNAIEPDATPIWGIMNGRNVVEHLTGSMRMSNGRFDLPLRTPEDRVAKYKAWLLRDDTVLTPNVPNDPVPEETPATRDDSIEQSRKKHAHDLNQFFTRFKENPDDLAMHPVFGLLNFREWVVFHYKHYQHHLAQFRQVPLPEHAFYDEVRKNA